MASIQGPHEGYVTAEIDLDFLKACREKQGRYTEPAPVIYQRM